MLHTCHSSTRPDRHNCVESGLPRDGAKIKNRINPSVYPAKPRQIGEDLAIECRVGPGRDRLGGSDGGFRQCQGCQAHACCSAGVAPMPTQARWRTTPWRSRSRHGAGILRMPETGALRDTGEVCSPYGPVWSGMRAPKPWLLAVKANRFVEEF